MNLLISSFFDCDFYLLAYTDIANANIDPAQHFTSSGVYEGRLCCDVIGRFITRNVSEDTFLENFLEVYESAKNYDTHHEENLRVTLISWCLEAFFLYKKPVILSCAEMFKKKWTNDSGFLSIHSKILFFKGDYQKACYYAEKALDSIERRNERHDPLENQILYILIHSLSYLDKKQEALELVYETLVPYAGWKTSYFNLLTKISTTQESVQLLENIVSELFDSRDSLALHALNTLATITKEQKNFKASIFYLNQLFKNGISSRPSSISKNQIPHWELKASRALLDLKEVFSKTGIDLFLISGTLLGCIREGGFIKYDKDIDVGIMSHVNTTLVIEAIKCSELFEILPVNSPKIYIRHIGGALIDIFIHHETGGIITHEGSIAAWQNSSFNLKETDFLGERFLVPANEDLYLSENYGDWKTPNLNFDTILDTPNMHVTDHLNLEWYHSKKLYEYYVTGNVILLKRTWDTLCKLVKPSQEMELAYFHALLKVNQSIGGKSNDS